MKDKHLTIRISQELHNSLVKKALENGLKENKIIKLSELIREILENNI